MANLCSSLGVLPVRIPKSLFQTTKSAFRRNSRYVRVDINSLDETLQSHRTVNNPPKFRRLKSLPPYDKWLSEQQILHDDDDMQVERSRRAAEFLKEREEEVDATLLFDRDVREKPVPLRRGFRTKRHHKPKFSTTVRAAGTKKTQCPWLDHMNGRQFDGYVRLNEEIKAFEAYMSEIPQEENAAKAIVREVSSTLVTGFIKPPVLVGSRATGMSMRHSNIDLLIPIEDPVTWGKYRSPSETRPVVGEIQMECLNLAARLLRADGKFSTVTLERSRIPYLVANHAATGLTVQLHCGIRPSASLEYILNYQAEFPSLRPLYFVMRMILENRMLFGTQNNSVGPYGLILMIVAVLKLGPNRFRRNDLGGQLLQVLKFYRDLNCRRFGISIEPPGLFRKRANNLYASTQDLPHLRGQTSIGKKSLGLGSDMLCLQDPSNYMNDLGMFSFWTLRLQKTFELVHDDIKGAIRTWNGYGDDYEIGTNFPSITAEKIETGGLKRRNTWSLFNFALGDDYDRVEHLRDRIILGSTGE